MAKTKSTKPAPKSSKLTVSSHGMQLRDRTIAVVLFAAAALVIYLGVTKADPSPVTDIVASSNGAGYWVTRLDGSVKTELDAATDLMFPDDLPISDAVAATPRTMGGFWVVSSTGAVYGYGGAEYYGGLDGSYPPAPIVDIIGSDAGGYRLLGRDGRIYDFNLEPLKYHGAPSVVTQISDFESEAVAAVGLPDASGFWVVDNMGIVYAFGEAEHLGDLEKLSGLSGNDQIADMVLTEQNGVFGYALATKDGEVFAFPNGKELRCLGDELKVKLDSPLVAASTLKGGLGCLFIDEKGEVSSFGDAPSLEAD